MMLLHYFIGLSALLSTVSTESLLSTILKAAPSSNQTDTNQFPVMKEQKKINYETLGGGYEGDMILPPGFDPKTPQEDRALAIVGPHQWPNNVIPYDLSGITSQNDRDFIENAMHTLMYAVGTPIQGSTERQTCVYFRPRTAYDSNYFRIVYGTGCSGTVGYTPYNDHVLTLQQPGCFYSGTIQHELVHVLGFYHEQSRPDRDWYITVNYNNIQPGMEYNFNKYQWGSDVLNQNYPYDYESIMHYDAYAFSDDNLPTITPKRRVTIGQRDGLSEIDIAEVRAYYRCK